MPLSMDHSAGGAIFDVNNLNLQASPELLAIGKSMGRIDELMNFSDTGRKLKRAVRINPICTGCFMVMPSTAICPDCS